MHHDEPPSGRPAQAARVLIVDDDARVRRALRDLIESCPELTVVGTAGSVRAALGMEHEVDPDVVLLDLLLPRASDGVQVLRELRDRNRTVIAMSALGSLRQRALDGGAIAFVEKEGRDVDALHDLLRAAVTTRSTTAGTRPGSPARTPPGTSGTGPARAPQDQDRSPVQHGRDRSRLS